MANWSRVAATLSVLAGALLTSIAHAQTRPFPTVMLPPVGLRAGQMAIVVNDSDPLSVRIGHYYAAQRSISSDHVLHVVLDGAQAGLDRKAFDRIKADLDARLPAEVEALVLTWAQPYRVDCMSITMAFAAGFDEAYCASGCQPTKRSAYFNSDTARPAEELRLRPTMMLAARDFARAKALIDRGIRSDAGPLVGTAYLMDTPDVARNVRAGGYPLVMRALVGAYPMAVVRASALVAKDDVMFYFTGTDRVAQLDRVRFLDGAIADHLTSSGGMLTDSPQMSSLQWLEAGATGSYGAVVEPCNFPEKFPQPAVVMGRYLTGETLLEAYWKSVAMPGQGVFIGDPLARPFGRVRMSWVGADLAVETRAIRPGRYALQESTSLMGPFRFIGRGEFFGYGVRRLQIPQARADRVYRLVLEGGSPPSGGSVQ